jgi:hypothetical protein
MRYFRPKHRKWDSQKHRKQDWKRANKTNILSQISNLTWSSPSIKPFLLEWYSHYIFLSLRSRFLQKGRFKYCYKYPVTAADGIYKAAILHSKNDALRPSMVPFELAVSGMHWFNTITHSQKKWALKISKAYQQKRQIFEPNSNSFTQVLSWGCFPQITLQKVLSWIAWQ